MVTDPLTKKQYFPDIKLKNTWLGQAKRHQMTSFMPFMEFAELSMFSRHNAERGQRPRID
jgi:hypothetical protein